MPEQYIFIKAAALDEAEGSIVLRGVVAADTLDHLQVGPYQREVLPEAKIADLADVFVNGERLPDIELGMRGQRFETLEDGTIVLQDPVFIIDGLQRVSAGMHVVNNKLATPHLGCLVHFSTTEEWERDRFRKLNMLRTKLSSNIILRNMKDEVEAVAVLYALSETERTSPIYGRVCWQQRMSGSNLFNALQLLKVAGHINARFGPGRSVRAEDLAKSLDKTCTVMGDRCFVGNVRTFYNLIDECFGLRRRTVRSGATCLRDTFTKALAWVLVEHQDFWQGQQLVIPTGIKKKLAGFNTNDPEVMRLASSSGQAWITLRQMLLEHIDSGKRAENRLKRFPSPASGEDEVEDDEEDERVTAIG